MKKEKNAVSKNGLITNSYIPSTNGLVKADKCGEPMGCYNACDQRYGHYDIKYLHKFLPLIEHAAEFKANLIIGNGIVVKDGSDAEQKRLDDFLNESDNFLKIKDSIKNSLIYGHSLIRLIDYNGKLVLQKVGTFNFKILAVPTEVVGYKIPSLYLVRPKKEYAEDSSYDPNEHLSGDEAKPLVESDDLFTLLLSDVIHLKLNDYSAYGVSPFLFDRLRIQLILDGLLYNIEDLSNGGISKHLVWLKDSISARSLGISDAEMQNPDAFTDSINQVVDKTKKVFHKTFNEAPRQNSVVVANQAHLDHVDSLHPSVKSIEYMQYIQSIASELVPNAMHMHPALFQSREGGASATSLEPILDYTISTLTAPQQKLFEVQIFPKLAKRLGIKGEIVFDALDTTDLQQMADLKLKYSQIAQNLMTVAVPESDVHNMINTEITEVSGNGDKFYGNNLRTEDSMKADVTLV